MLVLIEAVADAVGITVKAESDSRKLAPVYIGQLGLPFSTLREMRASDVLGHRFSQEPNMTSNLNG